jgi:protein TonB
MHYVQPRSPGANAVGIGFVIVLHIGIGYALLTALGVTPRLVVPQSTPAVVIVDPPKPPEEFKPIELPNVETPKLNVPYIKLPDIVVVNPTPPLSGPTTSEPPVGPIVFHPIPAPAPDVYKGPVRLGGPPIVYPSRAPSMGLTGSVDVECDVDETGRTSMCAVVAHEGSNMFVETALAYVQASRYSPATRNGVAVTEPHHRFHIMFDLK